MKLDGKRALVTGGSSGIGFAIVEHGRRPRWFDTIRSRQATVRAYSKGEPFSAQPAVTEEGKKLLFGQTAASVAKT